MARLTPRKEAYVTMITTDSFLPGAEALLESIREQQAILAADDRRAVLCMVTEGVSSRMRSKLTSRGATVVEVPSIGIPGPELPAGPPAGETTAAAMTAAAPALVATPAHVASWAATGYTKLNLWRLGLAAWGGWEGVVYVDADAVVLEDLSPLFARLGPGTPLLAAPDVFPPDRFNAGVLGLWLDQDGATLADMLSKLAALGTYDSRICF